MIIQLFQILTYKIVYIRALYIYLQSPLSYAHHMPIHRICNCSDIYIPNAWYLSTYCKQERYVTWWHDFIWPWTSQSIPLSVMDNVLHLAPNDIWCKIPAIPHNLQCLRSTVSPIILVGLLPSCWKGHNPWTVGPNVDGRPWWGEVAAIGNGSGNGCFCNKSGES